MDIVKVFDKLIYEGNDIDIDPSYGWNDYLKWSGQVKELLLDLLGEEVANDFVSLGSDHDYELGSSVGRQLGKLGALRIRLLADKPSSLSTEKLPIPSMKKQNSDTAEPIGKMSLRVFLVHGHDEAIKESAARFLEKIGLQPIILHEKPDAGRTIIEKFEAYSDVGFAVVLLTADDKGCAKSKDSTLQPRARQNVIFELGFFIGQLGRARVCALYREGVEIPSDYQGILYTAIDSGGAWKLKLAKELRAAGLKVEVESAI